MIKGFIWDLDGVITDTSKLHMEAWIEALRININGQENKIIEDKYNQFFSGVPRLVGIKRFLEASGNYSKKNNEIEEIAKFIANFKNQLFREKVENLKIEVYPDALRLLEWSNSNGIKNGLASQSENADLVLDKTGIRHLLDSSATGITAKRYRSQTRS